MLFRSLHSSVDRTIVESINEVAHRLGVKTVAEYVEEHALIGVLEEAGVDFVQGYAIGRPQPLSALFEQQHRGVGSPDGAEVVARSR